MEALVTYILLFLAVGPLGFVVSFSPSIVRNPKKGIILPGQRIAPATTTVLHSTFYNDFENFDEPEENDDEEDDEDEDEYEIIDDGVEDFRKKMASMFGGTTDASPKEVPEEDSSSAASDVDDLIAYARQKQLQEQQQLTEWAKTADLKEGVVLIANPAHFCSDFSKTTPSPALLAKYGLTLPPPADLGPDRRADLLPVLFVVESEPGGIRAVLLNRRTGYLLGDLEQQSAIGESSSTPLLVKFCIQPLWFGGIDNDSMGLDMLHQCPVVPGAKKLTEDGLYWGGDPAAAQDSMADPSIGRVLTGFDFKFFVQSTRWHPPQLKKEVENGTWFVAKVSKEVLFKSRDRMGTQRAKVRASFWLRRC